MSVPAAGASAPPGSAPVVVAKIGTSSITGDDAEIDRAAVAKFAGELAGLRADGYRVVAVSSGSITAGLPALGLADQRPRDARTLQAVSAVGQTQLMRVHDEALATHGLVAGQVLLAPMDFGIRQQYLHARGTMARLLELGVVPVVNENDTVADDEIRFGDNDRLAALVSHLVSAEVLVLLTDAPGLFTGDPRIEPEASLIAELREIDQALEDVAGGAGTVRGSGGMASKVAAAKMAAWSGVRTVIAAADRPDVLADAVAGTPGVGTVVHPRPRRLGARKLWIGFAVPARGRVTVDAGARHALERRGASLLAAGVTAAEGDFAPSDAVEVADDTGTVFAKGLVGVSAADLRDVAGAEGHRSGGDGAPPEVIHRDDLVLVPARATG